MSSGEARPRGSLQPAWEGALRDAQGLRARGVVPEDLVWLAGHFPGQPVVPAFVQLDWALALAREHLGLAEAPEAVEALRFRHALLPGACVEVRLDARADRLAFALRSPEGEAFASGRVRWGTPPRQHAVSPMAAETFAPDASDPADAPAEAWPLRLPQTGRMRLVDRVVGHTPEATTALAEVRASTPLCRAGLVPAWVALEWLAQGMAAHGGLVAGASPARGLLLGTRQLRLHTRAFVVGERLWIRAEPLRASGGLVAFDCTLGTGAPARDAEDARARALARAALSAFVEGPLPERG